MHIWTHLTNCERNGLIEWNQAEQAVNIPRKRGTCSSVRIDWSSRVWPLWRFSRGRRCKVKLARPISKVLLHRRESGLSLFSYRLFVSPVRIHVWANCKLSEHSARGGAGGKVGRVCSTVGRSSALTFAWECFSFPCNVQERGTTHTKKLPQHPHSEQSQPLCKAWLCVCMC